MSPNFKMIVPHRPEDFLTPEQHEALASNELSAEWVVEFVLAMWSIIRDAHDACELDLLYEYFSNEVNELIHGDRVGQVPIEEIDRTLSLTFDAIMDAILAVYKRLRPYVDPLVDPSWYEHLETMTYTPFPPQAMVITFHTTLPHQQWTQTSSTDEVMAL